MTLRKLLAVAVAMMPLAALAEEAAKPTPPLATIYGTLNLNLQWIQAIGLPEGSTAGNVQSRWAVSADSSNLGVRGTLPVQFGLSAIYQCESSAKLDGTGNTSICDRNSRVGLSSDYGTLFLGNWDTPLKAAYYGTKADDPFGNTDVYGANDIMGSPGFNYRSSGFKTTTTGTVLGFDIRAQNSVVYHSPKIQGLSFKLQTSVNKYADVRDVNTPVGANDRNPDLWGAVVNFDAGPLSLLAAWEQHDDAFGLNGIVTSGFAPATVLNGAGAARGTTNTNASRDTAFRVGAGYEIGSAFGATTVGVVAEKLTYTQRHIAIGGLREFSRPAYQITAKHRYGDHELRARFNWADKGQCTIESGPDCSTSGLAAHQVTLGYAYYLAKTTQVYAFYTHIMNGSNASYTPGAGGSLSGAPAIVGATPVGTKPEAAGVGMRYAF